MENIEATQTETMAVVEPENILVELPDGASPDDDTETPLVEVPSEGFSEDAKLEVIQPETVHIIRASNPKEVQPQLLTWEKNSDVTDGEVWRCTPEHPRQPLLYVAQFNDEREATISVEAVFDGKEKLVFRIGVPPINGRTAIEEAREIASALYWSWCRSAHPEWGGYVAPPEDTCPGKVDAYNPATVTCPADRAACASWGQRMAARGDAAEAAARNARDEARRAEAQAEAAKKGEERAKKDLEEYRGQVADRLKQAAESVTVSDAIAHDRLQQIKAADAEIAALDLRIEELNKITTIRLTRINELAAELADNSLARTRKRLQERGEQLRQEQKAHKETEKLIASVTAQSNEINRAALLQRALLAVLVGDRTDRRAEIPFVALDETSKVSLDLRMDQSRQVAVLNVVDRVETVGFNAPVGPEEMANAEPEAEPVGETAEAGSDE